MAVTRRTNLGRLAFVTVGCVVALTGSAVVAQPLVSGGLVLYYDVNSFTNTVTDGSGNGFNAKVQDATRNVLDQPFLLNTTGVISNETVEANVRRGAGAIRFTQSAVPGEDPVFIDMDGGVISGTADGIGGTATDLPTETNAITMAAWVNATGYTGDFTVFNGASGGHGVPHFQIQGSGQIRFTIRNSAGQNQVDTGNAASPGTSVGHPWTNQPAINAVPATPPVPWPVNEWHHVAITYDLSLDFDGGASASVGQLDVYYDGVKIKTQGGVIDTGTGLPFPGPIGPWQLRAFSDYYDGLGIGSVYDSGSRRTQGLIDEAYIFNRKLTDDEVRALWLVEDYNKNKTDDAADFVLWRNDPNAYQGDPAGYNRWRANFGQTYPSPGAGSAAGAAVPEPASLALMLLSLSYFALQRRR